MNLIANEALRPQDVPPPGARWEDLERFALTFDGYKAFGQRLGDLANQHCEAGTVPADLSELRGCLFFEQRRWRHFMESPDAATRAYLERLLEGIRRIVAAR